MTFARLRDILNLLDQDQLSQEAYYLIKGKLEQIDYVDSFRGDKEMSIKFNSTPHQVFLTSNKEL